MIQKEMLQEELTTRLEQLLKDCSKILRDKKVSCSIGVYHFEYPQDMTELMKKTDKVLYKAKHQGRAQYVLYHENN
jgi:PleD family two-component response regulator